ncbi:hypothetical protein [Leptospira mtsangambouensis]|uniref:hypothetical protein n=1 Tax=Leptospira mtsangambouensis TaxID=2484912 RepID=UPI001EEC1F99|nr:hypothetical protein [Leptospira mtsangambouensis]MCG6142664.1 hypothetical protein [Leptospira mtsangambouensis]
MRFIKLFSLFLLISCNNSVLVDLEEKANDYVQLYRTLIKQKRYDLSYRLTTDSYREKVTFDNYIILNEKISAKLNSERRVLKEVKINTNWFKVYEPAIAEFVYLYYNNSDIIDYEERFVVLLTDRPSNFIEYHYVFPFKGKQEYISENLENEINLERITRQIKELKHAGNYFSNCTSYRIIKKERELSFDQNQLKVINLLNPELVQTGKIKVLRDKGILAYTELGRISKLRFVFISGIIKAKGFPNEENLFIVKLSKEKIIEEIKEYSLSDFFLTDEYVNCS